MSEPTYGRAKVCIEAFNLHYGDFHALKSVSLEIPHGTITALIGPSGCGKSTLLRSINRMNDVIVGVRTRGRMTIDGQDIYSASADVDQLRRKIGMVFQRPNPFPLTVFENVAYGPRLHGRPSRDALAALVEESLRGVGLWDMLRDRLDEHALDLSAEQQQRLCIARALATRPDVLLMDEPCSALDPIATKRIEALMADLAGQYTIVIVTHNMQQAQRVSSHAGFMLLGELVEFAPTATLFAASCDQRTADYVAGRFG
ncbi:MAG: phosphate ABC transporter ATP-binding protein [Gemmatimonadaceae bacterium]|nr:phosphate ABC transporter ATP-binding protein [Gemmatimonadaceae bacterium]